jgi:hypothetical protein
MPRSSPLHETIRMPALKRSTNQQAEHHKHCSPSGAPLHVGAVASAKSQGGSIRPPQRDSKRTLGTGEAAAGRSGPRSYGVPAFHLLTLAHLG